MKLSKLILSLLSAFLMIACGNSGEKRQTEIEVENKELPTEERAEQALYKELMRVHDEAMPKMDKIMQLKGNLQQQLDLLRDAENTDSEKVMQLEEANDDLEAANEGMMQWMRNFKPLETGDKSHEEKMAYYREKKEGIEKVSQEIDNAIKEAKKLQKDL